MPERIVRWHLLALAHFGKGNVGQGKAAVEQVNAGITEIRQQRAASLEKAEIEARKKDPNAENINKALSAALPTFTTQLTNALNLQEELAVHQALAEGNLESARDLRRKLKGQPEPRLIRLDILLGNTDDAVKAAETYAKKNTKQVHATAQWIEALRAANKVDEATKLFDELRDTATYADADLAILKRLNETADWRHAPQIPADLGSRPALDSLGPLLWHASPAPAWSVTDAEGKTVRSEDYAGKPYVAIFFLGKGCPHCIRQLQAFEPQAAAYAKAGLPILTFSTDIPLGVAETVKLGKEGAVLPFPIFSDATHGAFHAFNAFDDFESKPLHGTFLVDSAGLIRWQHISYEPFMRAEFLLEEAQRLLKFPHASPKVAATAEPAHE
jgi:peroxiredoxin